MRTLFDEPLGGRPDATETMPIPPVTQPPVAVGNERGRHGVTGARRTRIQVRASR